MTPERADGALRPVITAFAASPDRGRGQARDTRVRWALEEVGQPYAVRLVSFAEMKEAPHLARQPFGQIPSYEEGGLVLFESGAIVLHLAETRAGLLPEDPVARARAKAWVFAALNTVEPLALEREAAVFTEGDKPWQAEHLAMIEARIRVRLGQLARALGGGDWLEGSFSVGDLVMVGVLRRLGSSGVVAEFDTLARYVARAEARPAFRRAFAAQEAVFLAGQGKG